MPNRHTDVGVPAGPISFTVSDPDTPLADLMLFESSSDTTLVPLTGITFGGSGANRTVTPTAGLSGAALITVTVFDGDSAAHAVFTLTVGDENTVYLPLVLRD